MRHIALLALLLYLGGCGQTGPLYLPGEAPVQGPEENTTITPDETAP
jgi:predicted small lipoprotein YifL